MPISASDLSILQLESDRAARRLARQYRIPAQDIVDLRQELLAEAIARLGSFDPARGSLGAFAGMVMAQRAARLALRIRRERLLFGEQPVSLDAPLPDGSGTIGSRVPEDQGLAAMFGQPVDAFAAIERRLDVERGLGRLPRRDAALSAALSRFSIDQLVARGKSARSGLYRRLAELRFALLAAGVQPA